MNTLLIPRHHLLQISSVSVKGLASLQPYSTEVGKKKQRVRPTDPGVKPFSAIPGPPSLPVIGTLWDYYRGKYNLQKPHETYSTFLKNYGPLVREKVFLGNTLVHVFHPQDLKEVHTTGKRSSLPIRHSHGALKMYRNSKKDLYGHIGVAPSNGEEWWSYRKQFIKDIHPIGQIRPAFEEIADDLIEYMKSNLDHNGEIPVFPALYYYTLESIGMFVLGTRIGCFEQDHGDDVTSLIQAVHESHYAIHQTEYKPYILARKERKTLEISQDYIAHFVLKHMDNINELIDRESEKRIDQFNEMRKSDDLVIQFNSNFARIAESFLYKKLKDGLTKRMILPMAVDFIQGGIHSTAHSLAFELYHLAMNPDKQDIFREELVKNFPNKTDRMAVSQLNSQYVRCIIAESLRLNPPTIGTGRVLSEDLVLSGYHVPKGTKVILHHEIASKHEDIYPEPLRFIPERIPYTTFASNPFIDLSRRVCMGILIANLEMALALMKIFRHFEVSYHYKKVGVVNYLVNEPDAPIKLRLKEISDNVGKHDDGTTEGN